MARPVGVCDVFRDALRAIDLGGPLRHAAEHAPVVDLLERLAVDEVAADLSDEQDHRRRILRGRVHADRGIRGAGTARHEGDAGTARELAVRLRHVGGTAFLPAHDERQPVADVVERVEHREIALARHRERVRRALREEVGDEDFAAGAGRGHGERAAGQATRPHSI